MFKCDDYFEANNVTVTRGIKGLASGVIMDNIRNIAVAPHTPQRPFKLVSWAVVMIRDPVFFFIPRSGIRRTPQYF
jgi:hypothetical protein